MILKFHFEYCTVCLGILCCLIFSKGKCRLSHRLFLQFESVLLFEDFLGRPFYCQCCALRGEFYLDRILTFNKCLFAFF